MRPIDADALEEQFSYYIIYGVDVPPEVVAITIFNAPTIEQPTWISCAERLPERSGYYLVVYRDKYNGNRTVTRDMYAKNEAGEWWENDFMRTATHWMPMPELPKGDE